MPPGTRTTAVRARLAHRCFALLPGPSRHAGSSKFLARSRAANVTRFRGKVRLPTVLSGQSPTVPLPAEALARLIAFLTRIKSHTQLAGVNRPSFQSEMGITKYGGHPPRPQYSSGRR